MAAGGKLYNVVVDTENTGKQLLQKGGLQRRVTIIPLNKIHSDPVSRKVQDAAVKLVITCNPSVLFLISFICYTNKHVIYLYLQVGKGNAAVALSLVGYDQELQVSFYTTNFLLILLLLFFYL